MKTRYSAKDRSYELGWNLGQAVQNECFFFMGIFSSQRTYARRDGWLKMDAYVKGYLAVMTDYGRKPRRTAK